MRAQCWNATRQGERSPLGGTCFCTSDFVAGVEIWDGGRVIALR
jgi:hypothetical protein